MSLEISPEVLHLGLRDPFRIARSDHGGGHEVTTVIIEIRDTRFPGTSGVGEGYPDRFYGETPETMSAVLPILVEAIGDWQPTRSGLVDAGAEMDRAIRGHGAAKCALDIGLHDLAGKVAEVPVHELLGLRAELPPTDFTIGIDEPDVVAERARRASAFPALKIKVGGREDLATLQAVRAVYGGPIRVDANTGWTLDGALDLLPELERPASPAGPAPTTPGPLQCPDCRGRELRLSRGPRWSGRDRRRGERQAREVRRHRTRPSDA